MISQVFSCIFHLLWVYYELTKWLAPRWLDNSVGRGTALVSQRSWVSSWELITLWVRNIPSSETQALLVSMVRYFRAKASSQLTTPGSPRMVYYKLTKWPAPRWLDSLVFRGLHWYRRGHGYQAGSWSHCEFVTYHPRRPRRCWSVWCDIFERKHRPN